MRSQAGRQLQLIDPGGSLPPGFELRNAYLSSHRATSLMDNLMESAGLGTHSITVFGQTCPMPRRIAWYGDQDYSYSGVHHPARALPPMLNRLALQLERDLGQPFNCVLLNHYRTGRDSMGWHSDDDYKHDGHPLIASISLGATRRFRLRAKQDPSRSLGLDLEHGSLFVMGANTQRTHAHAVTRTRRAVAERLNLTFRFIAPR